jgi:hypothetical protein
MSTPIADQSVSWACTCGFVSWQHHENCDRCGKARPVVEVEAKEPSHTPLTEAALTTYDMAAWLKANSGHDE